MRVPGSHPAFAAALSRCLLALALLCSAAVLGAQTSRARSAAVPSPTSILGFQPGADRTLADWPQITGYFSKLAAASPAVHVDTLGLTTQQRPFILVAISTPANIRNLPAILRAQAKLADPRLLTSTEERRLIATQPAIVFVSCNIHATEIASSQMAMELAYRLATNDTLQRALRNVVVVLVPSMNPDGQQIVTDWYRDGVGTKYEGGALPWLYHPYVGHDNNRDWYMITQVETKLVTDALYRRWFPEIFYDVHQQGTRGMRLTVPPHVDPIDPNVEPLIVRGINLIGATMSQALEERGKAGVGDGVTYDLWWHGGARSAPTRHNMIGLLTEAASARIATPITLDSADMRGHARGLPRYERKVNFPNPWWGGTWRMRDIVDYELIAAEALVQFASDRRGSLVGNFVQLGRTQLRRGATEAPYAYVIPADQWDAEATAVMISTLRAGGVEIDRLAEALLYEGVTHPAGSHIVRMDQPYRAHAKDLLEVQRFPAMLQYPGGPVERPYDVAGWTLPLQMGVKVVAITTPGIVPARGRTTTDSAVRPRACTGPAAVRYRDTGCYRARGATSAAPTASAGAVPRVALYRPWTGNMDEGWTRWVLEKYGMAYVTLTDSMVRTGRLRDQFDVVLVPDMSLREARDGQSADSIPARYAGGLGAAGLAALRTFAETGGTLVLLDRASEIATSALGVNVRRITAGGRARSDDDAPSPATGAVPRDSLPRRGESVYAPGSILRVLVDPQHPVAAGMPDTAAVYFTNSTTFEVPAGSSARVIARYPARGDDILLSGFLQGAERLAGQAAAVDVPVGRGRVVLLGFRPQYRGQSYGTFRMLFNALLLGSAPTDRPGASSSAPPVR